MDLTPASHRFDESERHAHDLDAADPLRGFRERFTAPQGKIYLLGNSLGLMCEDALREVQRVMVEWERNGVGGWFEGDQPWVSMAERLGSMCAPIMGAKHDEVVATGTTTVNIHSLVSTLFTPSGHRDCILADELNFPSDLYALAGQLRLRGLDPCDHLLLARSRDGRFIEEEDVIDMMTDRVALVHLPSVVYRSGQLLDMERLARAARERGMVVGFDCCHSAGLLPHRLDDWDVDYAVWCSYKYLNGGPGASAFLYINRRHFDRVPMLPGWFGYEKRRQFEMNTHFEHQRSAGGWQISSPTLLGAAPIQGALRVILEAGMERIRHKSLAMTSYLMRMVDALPDGGRFGVKVGTPADPARRGGHVALESSGDGMSLFEALTCDGIVVDHRPPGIIRVAPSSLYNGFHDLWRVVQVLR